MRSILQEAGVSEIARPEEPGTLIRIGSNLDHVTMGGECGPITGGRTATARL
jgi:hypothetical protein